MATCPCGSGKEFKDCCEPLITGVKPATSAEALMRSRYTAYATENVDYILSTTHASKTAEVKREEVSQWSKNTEWKRLEILSTPSDDKVEFVAYFRENGDMKQHHELASFKQEAGKWYFYDAEFPKPETVINAEKKVGRNEPCPCGSGKKFKKCCGKK